MSAMVSRGRNRAARASQAGFSMLEIAVALVVASVLSWASFSAYEAVAAQQEIERGRAEARQLQSIVRAFALRHGRLPCPDTGAIARGYESMTAGECTAGNQLGWFPYVSVGLEIPEQTLRARYAVFRARNVGNPLLDADLALAIERTSDSAGEVNFLAVTDLIAGLNNAAALPLATDRSYLTGDMGAAGSINCAANAVMAVAYWVVVPLKDADNDGNRLDAPHALAGLCAASPSAPPRFGSDDVVVAESAAQLAGWLRKSLP